MYKKIALILIIVFTASALFAKDIVININREEHIGEETKKTDIDLYISGEKVKMMWEGSRQYYIFRGDKDAIWLVDTKKKEYMEFDKDLVKKVAAMREKAITSMEKSLAKLPEAQREMAKKMMKQRMDKYMSEYAEEAKKFSYNHTDITKNMEGYPCRKVEVFDDTLQVEDLWITDWKNIEYNEEIKEAYTSMMSFVDSLKTNFQSKLYNNAIRTPFMIRCQLGEEGKLDGYPIYAVHYDADHNITDLIYLDEIKSEELPANTFTPPEDYILKQVEFTE
ncbi:MAG: hypothetical protein KGY74_08775 [Candidatus Cloacimonetes bacterium]|nr:hypothetical protein [Candidatus Cloacimonadota bacterium]